MGAQCACTTRIVRYNSCSVYADGTTSSFFTYGGAPNGRIKLGSLGVASHHFAAGGKSAYRKIIHYLLSLFFIFTVAESQPIVVSDTAELAPSIDPPVNVGLGPIVQHPYYPSHPTDARPGQQYQGHDQTIFYGLSALLQIPLVRFAILTKEN